MRILLLEDDRDARDYLVKGLAELGHNVAWESDGKAALRLILTDDFDVLILDRLVPGLDGLTVLRLAREAGCKAPAIILSAMSGIEDRVSGLEGGADDYLVKPFAFAELAARLVALARRLPINDSTPPQTMLRAGDIEMDLVRRTVRRSGKPIDVQPREFSLLEYLMRNANRVVTRTMLLDRVWNFGFDPKTNIVETHISRLRTKLNAGHEGNVIRVVRGSGYILATDEA
ncbi:response regulator transcription factor [Sphingomonas montanisoli]|uniref:Response regulator transcription factor n=1 Tax=Sphingomonas montanisoli TaxID=2606412 RepID=A0A5D9C8L6_9SPHN|nr:response regulator transcription factor [Sphingomonas montanisoli]TZG28069.1 response regulator transcription factor [Sphingomonas montanisoli]